MIPTPVLASLALAMTASGGSLAAQTAQAPRAERAEPRFEKLLMTGDDAPGFAPGEAFLAGGLQGAVGVGAPRIDDDGVVVFGGLVDTPSQFVQALWRHSGGAFTVLARAGDAAGGTTSTFFSFPSLYSVQAPSIVDGQVSFHGSLADPFAEAIAGTWLAAGSTHVPLVMGGDPVPGAPAGSTFGYAFAEPTADGSSYVVAAPYSPPSGASPENEGFWRDDGTGLQLVVRDGLAAPGTPAGTVFGDGTSLAYWATFDEWSYDETGHVAFNAYLKGPDVTVTNDEGIWVEDEAGLRLVVREGDPAPAGSGPNGVLQQGSGFRTFGTVHHVGPQVNADHDVLFSSALSGAGFDYGEALVVARDDQLELVAKFFPPAEGVGSAAPGLPGFVFTDLYDARFSDAGDVAFLGFATDGTTVLQGIWSDVGGTLDAIALEGSPTPLAGETFDSWMSLVELSDDGRLTFESPLSSGGRGRFVVQPNGSLESQLFTGMTVDVAANGSDVRVVSSWSAGAANAQRELPLGLSFTDGSEGLFVMREPASGWKPKGLSSD